MTAESVVLGAPGVYHAPTVPQTRASVPRMDVAAFVGVAERGPAYDVSGDRPVASAGAAPPPRCVPVAVESWGEYLEVFGGFGVRSLLPHAVAAYFAEGGRRAYVVRVVAPPSPDKGEDAPAGCAHFSLGTLPGLRAANEGRWGNRLALRLVYTTRPLTAALSAPPQPTGVVLSDGSLVAVGSLLRVAVPGRDAVLRVVSRVLQVGRRSAVGRDVVAVLDQALPLPVPGKETAQLAELVEAELTVDDTDPERPRRERFTGLGTQPAHPRFLPEVLRRQSRLVAPVDTDAGGWVPQADLAPIDVHGPDRPGRDRSALVSDADVLGHQVDDEPQSEGIWALADLPDVGSLVVPDLFSDSGSAAVNKSVDPPPAVPCFRPCAVPTPRWQAPEAASTDLAGLALDPTVPEDLTKLVRRQTAVVETATALGLVALLDVPPRLPVDRVLRWRSEFDSSHAAAYHPWLRVPGPSASGRLVDVPPSAVAAGIIARRELRAGVARGPANERAATVVDLAVPLDDATHDTLHRLGVDVFRSRRDGVWLTGARTLSLEPGLRQLAVRRLLLLVERFVRQELAWAAFEPADDALRAGLRRHLDHLLGGFFDAGALAGRSADEAWFVDVGRPDEQGVGQLVVLVGIAPAEPLEYLLLRVQADSDGTVASSLGVGGAVLGGDEPVSWAGWREVRGG